METLVDSRFVLFDLAATQKADIVRILAEKFFAAGRISNIDGYVAAVVEREDSSSTAVGFSVATPHAKTDYALQATIGFARLSQEIQWDEDEKVSFVFLIAVPMKDAGDRHLRILAKLFRKLVDDDFRAAIARTVEPEEIVGLIDDIS